ncbi:MAG: aldehyde dehydrogenase [Roseibacillus sp.]|nr:aldehyde dehydrogenase [Roseibacillus sp.]
MNTSTRHYQMYLNGRWEDGTGTHPVLNPATEETIAEIPVATDSQIAEAFQVARKAQRSWARMTGVERGNVLRRWADLLEQNRDHITRVISQEVGKPIMEARGEFDFGNSWFRYYAEFDRRIDGEILAPDKPNEQLWIVPSPVGVVCGIIPWNFPFAVAVRKIAPALITGNALVLKPHESTPLSSLEIARLAEEAGVPPGVFQVLCGPGETVGEAMVKDPTARLITFTGSVPTGKRIARNAAENVALVSLEMGGKAPFIVMDDCDLDAAVETAVFSRFLNCGQICIANERTYLQKNIAGEFTEKFLAEVAKLNLGNPLEEDTRIGPKVSRGELEKVEAYVDGAREDGVKVLTGGSRRTGGEFDRGYWYEPTVLTGVSQGMDIMQREIFGPVVPLMEFDSFDDALELANDSNYGLAAYLFTNDMNRIMRTIRDLECGEFYINRGPGESIHGFHGGLKESGLGGDDGVHGLNHYLHRKCVYLKYKG